MSTSRKYQWILSGVVLISFYLVIGEAWGQWVELFRLYEELKQRESMVLDPEEFMEKKVSLHARKKTIAAMISDTHQMFRQSQTGVFDFLNDASKKTGVRIESFFPSEIDVEGQMKDINFKVNVRANYNKIGAFINTVETGGIAMRARKLEITGNKRGLPDLQASLEGNAYVFSQGQQ